ncbi:hypothetical protein CYMTET_22713 [Cymbomonas tetramitiformis]|uniref:Uncharacterized protein n=1 Tax=Cymbomonas tetramitiformis TaxID=36881 RepID=A0AAE0G0T3_9CHLO|nr:hypothetical protein CYMTET_22713 [Cymbomonas tetramitiformis]
MKLSSVEELEWCSNLQAVCMGAALFLMMFVHPGISTTMFQLFNCESVYFDDELLNPQYWLKLDSSIECFTLEWKFAMCASVFTLVVYVFGYPILLYLGMRRLRRYHKVRIPRSTAEKHIKFVQRGDWILCSSKDVAITHRRGSLTDTWSNTRYVVKSMVTIARRASHILHREVALNPSKPTSGGASIDAAHGSAVGGGEGVASRDSSLLHVASRARLPRRRGRSVSLEEADLASMPSLGRHWRQKTEMDNSPPVDIFLLKSSFVKCKASDVGSVAKARELLQERTEVPASSRVRARRRSCIQARDSAVLEDSELDTLMLRDGRILEGVICFEKPSVGDGGVITHVPVTRLDDVNYAKVLGQFRDPFEDEFFFWQSYEISRRMMQTGVVVLVAMLAGETASVMYGVLFSMVAIVLHQRYSPFKMDALDDLMLAILVNQFLVQMIIVMGKLKGQVDDFLGISFLLLQLVLLTYAMTLIVPAFRPAIGSLGKTALTLSEPMRARWLPVQKMD